ncbi:MAG: hypothetical protein LUF02_02015 [Erysipelotrichaceae bacterium]|nr:hypothetical protein [Erysipelotrichaceae bacterium]
MATQKEIEELVKMLDGHMSTGSGHINVKVNDDAQIEMEDVTVVSKMDCDSGDTACKIPNFPMDDDEEY